jgi:methylated-DNA-[protein]-cysteine S-methyltransferase
MPVAYLSSPVGDLEIETNDHFLLKVHFLDGPMPQATGLPDNAPQVLRETVAQLEDYFAGQRLDFDLPLGQSGTDFQLRVWDQLVKIAGGETISYHQLAVRLGDPKCIRAAGMANGRNNIAIVVPCHRVIGSDGTLVGYAGGLGRKKWLLQHEAAHRPQPQGLLF